MEQRSAIPWCDRRRTYCASGCSVQDSASNSGACDWEAKIKVVQLKFVNASSPGVAPSKESLVSDYPLSRPLYLVFDAHPNQATKLFTDFCSNPTAKAIISKAGFVDIR